MAGERPIFVVGFQRSGTTLLQGLLGAHPRIAAPPEMHYILRVAYFADLFGDLDDDANLRRALREALNPPVDLLAGCGFDEAALFERARAGERTYAGLFRTLMDDYAKRNGKARWSEKTPAQRPDDIYNLFPDAQVVHIVREPREVVASDAAVSFGIRRRPAAFARDLTHFTLETVDRGRRAGPDLYMQMRYEDLVADPEATLRSICAFLGEDFDPGMLDSDRRGSALTSGAKWQQRSAGPIAPSESKWREQIGWADRLRVEALTKDIVASYGYAEPSLAVRLLMPLARREFRLRNYVADRRARRNSPTTPEDRYAATQAVMHEAAARMAQ